MEKMQSFFGNSLVILAKPIQVKLPKGICGLVENGDFAEAFALGMSPNCSCPVMVVKPPANEKTIEKTEELGSSLLAVIPLEKIQLNGGGR